MPTTVLALSTALLSRASATGTHTVIKTISASSVIAKLRIHPSRLE
jgi:hypothetical protein